MNIGIITLYDNGNLGAALQAYALNRVLREMGNSCETIRYRRLCDGKSDEEINRENRKLLLKSHNGRREFVIKAVVSVITKRRRKQRMERIHSFIEDYIPQSTESYSGVQQLCDVNSQYDAFICGSDNIWNRRRFDSSYFLSFVKKGKKRYSYAAGFSASELSDQEKEKIIPLIEQLDTISVRDPIGRELLQKLSRAEIREDLDPTMLLLSREWSKIAEPEPRLVKWKYIFCYLLGNGRDGRNAAKLLKEKTGMKIITLPHATTIQSNDVGFGDIKLWDVSPQRFIWLVENASYIITDSFHGCVFSILFEKQFCVFRRFTKSDESELNLRLDGILNKLGIIGRIANSPENGIEIIQKEINYNEVNKKIASYREQSIAYLEQIAVER